MATTNATTPNIVLVHGAQADGSSWSKVIPILKNAGHRVIAVQLPLHSVADDVATVNRAIEQAGGPVLLVGHSYGGFVITNASYNNPNVTGLVYVAGWAPDVGESINDYIAKYPPEFLKTFDNIKPDSGGFAFLIQDKFRGAYQASTSMFPVGYPEWNTMVTASIFHKKCLTIIAIIVLCLDMKKKGDTQCVHIGKVNPNIHGNTKGCEECEKIGSDWVHLRLCLSCGHVGCCNSSPNKHGTKHFLETGHPIIKSYEPGEDWKWCYVDDIFLE